jgi:hypothetical protein
MNDYIPLTHGRHLLLTLDLYKLDRIFVLKVFNKLN